MLSYLCIHHSSIDCPFSEKRKTKGERYINGAQGSTSLAYYNPLSLRYTKIGLDFFFFWLKIIYDCAYNNNNNTVVEDYLRWEWR